jgi:hypothetical protein
MLILLRRRTGGVRGHGVWSTVFTAALLSAVMGVTVHFVKLALARIAPPGTLGELALVGGAGLAGLSVYVGLALLVRMDQVELLRRVVKR